MRRSLPDPQVLVVDDEEANLLFIERVLRRAGYASIETVSDPRQALPAFLRLKPDIVLLDLHMPHLDGFGVLKQLAPRVAAEDYLPIVVLTADISAEARQKALSGGAKDFLTKPLDVEEVSLRIANLLETRCLYLALRQRKDELQEDVLEHSAALERAQKEILERLALAAEYRDDETGEHTKRVGQMSARIAAALGLERGFVTLIGEAAPLHDIGKIAIPESILLKPEGLTPQEFDLVKTHTLIGAKILSGSTSPLLQLAEEIALTHHERWDGTGYSGLAGDAIPLSGRIVAVADVFDGLTHRRPYKPAWTEEDSLAEIRAQSGSQFDPTVVEAFEKALQAPPDPESELARAVEETELQRWQIQLLDTLTGLKQSGGSLGDLVKTLVTAITTGIETDGGCLYVFGEDESVPIAESWGTCASSQSQGGIRRQIVDHLLSAARHGVRFLEPRDVAFLVPWRHCISIPLTSCGDEVGVLELVDASLPLRNPVSEPFFRTLGEQIGSALRNLMLYQSIQGSQEQLGQLSQRLLGAQEEEKARIARDLHDEVGQILTGLKMSIDLSSQLPFADATAQLDEARLLAADALRRVRNMTLDLKPAALADLGLRPALAAHFARYTSQTGIEVRFESDDNLSDMTEDVETTAYRIIQESLTNVARHAGVNEVFVRVLLNDAILAVEIEDHGPGFQVETSSAMKSSGVSGMCERAALVGGRVEITAPEAGGTLIRATLPFNIREPLPISVA